MSPHWKLHNAKKDGTCSLCSGPIEKGQTVVYGKDGNVTCAECIGRDARDKPRVRESLARE